MSLHWEEVALSQKMFAGAALHDHVVARWAFQSGLHRHFAWNACQAVEKYSKCIVLLNSLDKIQNSHGVEELFKKASYYTSPLVPEQFEFSNYSLPSKIGRFRYPENHGFDETTLSFVARLGAIGAPDTRYRQSTVTILPLDLSKLDVLCNWLKRVCVPISKLGKCGKQYSEILRVEPSFDTEVDFPYLKPSYYLKTDDQKNMFKKHNIAIDPDSVKKMTLKFALQASEIETSAMTSSNRDIARGFLEKRFEKTLAFLNSSMKQSRTEI
jgi:HEPN domain-containing protein